MNPFTSQKYDEQDAEQRREQRTPTRQAREERLFALISSLPPEYFVDVENAVAAIVIRYNHERKAREPRQIMGPER